MEEGLCKNYAVITIKRAELLHYLRHNALLRSLAHNDTDSH